MAAFFCAISKQQVLAIAAIVAVSGIIGAYADFWGQSEGTQALSTRIVLAILAPWYTSFDKSADEVGDSIAIVLIDDETIAERNSVYPLPYDEQVNLIQQMTIRWNKSGDAIKEIKPTALFIDLLYADDRGVRERPNAGDASQRTPNNLATFAKNLEEEAENGTRVGTFASAPTSPFAHAYPPLATGYAGVLVADHLPEEKIEWMSRGKDEARSIAPLGALQTISLYGFVNRAKAPSAPSQFKDAPLRYALAPDGILSPAVVLTLWACAANDFKRHPRGCAVGGPISPEDVYQAAYAAAISDVAEACADLADPNKQKNLKTIAEVRTACRREAFDYAAQAGWAAQRSAAANSSGSDHSERQAKVAALLDAYAQARREGHFDGALEASHCLDKAFRLARNISPWRIREQAVAMCTDLSKNLQDDRRGPTMTVLWGVTPRDKASSVNWEPDDPPAAPYFGASNDRCKDFRIEGFWQQVLASYKGFKSTLFPALKDDPNVCAYHLQVRPNWLASDYSRTRNFVDWAVDKRVVMVGVSVAGVEDTFKLRGVSAPGVWAHAMALDNVLTFGRDYRRVSYGLGFESECLFKLWGIIIEAAIACAIAVGFACIIRKEYIENFIDNKVPEYISNRLASTMAETIASVIVFGFASLLLALFLFGLFSCPPLDWISVSLSAVLAWTLTKDPENSGKSNDYIVFVRWRSVMLRLALSAFALACSLSPALADSCEMQGHPVEAVMVRGSAEGKVGQGELGYKISGSELCFRGQTYSVREVIAKPVNENLRSRDCSAHVASSSALSSGAGRGNGC